MTFPNDQQREEAKQMIADHDKSNFYTFDQRLSFLIQSGNHMAGLVNRSCPMQVGDVLCAMDNARIPFEFRPEVSAQWARHGKEMRDLFGKRRDTQPKTVDDNVRELILRIMEEGTNDTTRTGINSRAVVGATHTYDISRGQIPAVSSKYTWIEGVKVELVWMVSGDTNIRFLKKHNVNIWDSWVKPGTEVYRDMTEKELEKSVKDLGLLTKFEEVYDQAKESGVNRENTLIHFLEAEGHTTKYLIEGELPRIYQHQWRGWEDTRVVPSDEVDTYKAKGYEYLGPLDAKYPGLTVYGASSVVHRKIDQLQKVIDQLRTNPDDRGIILSAWNVAELDEMALRPCHTLCQFFSVPMTVRDRLEWIGRNKPAGFEHLSEELLRIAAAHDDRRHETQLQNDPVLRDLLEKSNAPTRKLSSLLYQRSQDLPLGHPFNIVQYAMLTHMVAQVVGMATDTFTWVGGNVHIYEDQWPGVIEWLELDGHPESNPTIQLNPNVKDLFDFKVEDIKVANYKSSGRVKFPKAAV
jgi:thymidylate synthase